MCLTFLEASARSDALALRSAGALLLEPDNLGDLCKGIKMKEER